MPKLPEVHFRLKPQDDDGYCVIYLQFLYNKQRLFYSTGEKIKKSDWSVGKERAKDKSRLLTDDGEHYLNDLLDNLQKVCEDAYKKEKSKGIPTPTTLKSYLDAFIRQNLDDQEKNKFYEVIDAFISGEVKIRRGKQRGKSKAQSTLINYKVTKKHLIAFEIAKKYPLGFDSINMEFYDKFLNFLEEATSVRLPDGELYERDGLGSLNSIGNQIKNLKAFMDYAVSRKLTTNMEYRSPEFAKTSEDSDAVYLTEKEILKLYKIDFTNDKKLEQVRDLFCFGCWVGLRFSDYSTVQPENIVTDEEDGDLFIKMRPKKTGDTVVVPCSPLVLQVFEKYRDNPNKLPKALSNQKFNDYIKTACQKAGLTQTGRLETDMTKPLWQCISSHTARRSFATNLYLTGYPSIEIMKVTGHKTESAFLKYIKVTKLDAAKRLSAHMKEMWSKKMLRVAS